MMSIMVVNFHAVHLNRRKIGVGHKSRNEISSRKAFRAKAVAVLESSLF